LYSTPPMPPPSLWLLLLPLVAVDAFCVPWRLDNPPFEFEIKRMQTRIMMRVFQRKAITMTLVFDVMQFSTRRAAGGRQSSHIRTTVVLLYRV